MATVDPRTWRASDAVQLNEDSEQLDDKKLRLVAAAFSAVMAAPAFMQGQIHLDRPSVKAQDSTVGVPAFPTRQAVRGRWKEGQSP